MQAHSDRLADLALIVHLKTSCCKENRVGRSCPFFFRYNNNSYTGSCLCLIARDQQHSAQNKHPNSANIANSSRVSTAQTGFTAQPCIHAERKLIASSFTVGDERKENRVDRRSKNWLLQQEISVKAKAIACIMVGDRAVYTSRKLSKDNRYLPVAFA